MGRNLFASDTQTSQNKSSDQKRAGRNLFADSESENDEGFLSKLPRNVAIGLAHAGRNLHNLPHDIAQGVDVAGSAIGRALGAPELQKQNSNIASYLPNDEKSYAAAFGQKGKGTPIDNLLQKGIEYAPDIIGGANALRGIGLLPHLTRRGASKNLRLAKEKIKSLSTIPEDEFIDLYHGKSPELANKILKEGLESPKYAEDYALLTNNPSTAFSYGSRTSEDIPDILKISIPKNKISEYLHPENKNWTTASLKPRGHEESQIFGIKKPIPKEYISPHDYDNLENVVTDVSKIIKDIGGKKINISPELIKDAAQFLPKTSAYKNMLKEASKGDYNALFNLQSDLGKHSSDYAKSFFSAAERAHGRAGLTTRNKLLTEIHAGLNDVGHKDVSELLKKGQDEYRRYMKFKPYRNALGLAAGAYVAPKNPLTNLVKKLAFMNKD